MDQQQSTGSQSTGLGPQDGKGAPVKFTIDSNFGLDVGKAPWTDFLPAHGITPEATADLVHISQSVARHEPDIAYLPVADFHRLIGKGDNHYRGLAMATSKFTGLVRQRCLLVVRQDDPASSMADLHGAKFAYINKSCSSSYFPPAILLQRQGKKLSEFLDMTPVKPGPTWQGLIDAVVSKEVRATMVLQDTWDFLPKNAADTKVIGEYAGGVEGVVIARHGLDDAVRQALLDALLAWTPPWGTVYGGFKPFYYADVHAYFHDLDQLPDDL